MKRNKAATATIRPMRDADADSVLAIYGEGIETGHATFQERTPDWTAWDAGHIPPCRLVAEIADGIVGWAALSAVSARPVYRGVREVSVYVAARARGQGVGRELMAALVVESERHGIWTLQAGIFPENEASVALHRDAGFRIVGTRERLGLMTCGPQAGRWRDVLLLERRSDLIASEHEG